MAVATFGLWASVLVTLWIGSQVYYSTFFVFLDKILFYNSGEYIRAFRQTPLDPLVSLCLGLQYLHLASQRFPRHRHTCVIQVKKINDDVDDDDDYDDNDDEDDDEDNDDKEDGDDDSDDYDDVKGGSVAEWSARQTHNPAVPGSSPALATCWICSRSSRVQILGHACK